MNAQEDQPKSNQRNSALYGGWVSLGVAILAILIPFPTFWLYIPLILAAFICSIIVIAKGKPFKGVVLMGTTIIAPVLAYLLFWGVLLGVTHATVDHARQIQIESRLSKAKKLSTIVLGADLTTKVDAVRGLTFIQPADTHIREGSSCYLYISDNGDGSPSLFFRCQNLSPDIFHFDQALFRTGTNMFTIKHERFETMSTDIIGDESYGYNDFLVNDDSYTEALNSLTTSSDGQTMRFYSTTYNKSQDFPLSTSDINQMSEIFSVWKQLNGTY